MKRDIHGLAGLVLQSAGKSVPFLEVDSHERDTDDFLRDMVEIAYFEKPRSEFPVPADLI